MPRGRTERTNQLIEASSAVLGEIEPASIRAVAYQLFIRRVIPDMSKNSTNRVSRALARAREDGLIPWRWVVDEHRSGERVPSWDDPEDFAASVARQYRRDRWITQPQQVEIWSEKGTIRGTLQPILSWSGVTLRVMHGYSSAAVLHEVAEWSSLLEAPLLVFYVGDWDP